MLSGAVGLLDGLAGGGREVARLVLPAPLALRLAASFLGEGSEESLECVWGRRRDPLALALAFKAFNLSWSAAVSNVTFP